VVAKAINLLPNNKTCRSIRAGILLKDVDITDRILVYVKPINSTGGVRTVFAMGNPNVIHCMDDHQPFAIGRSTKEPCI
jgi:hypothetical protein